MEVLELTDGGQTADRIAARAAEFLRSARRSLEIALYDLRLPGAPGDLVAGALREAAERGVAVRLLYNVDSARPEAIHPPPATRPELLAELPIDAQPVAGVPGPDAPQVRGPRRRRGVDGLCELDGRFMDAPGERPHRRRLDRARGRLRSQLRRA